MAESPVKQKIRGILWRYFGSGIWRRDFHLPRMDLILSPGDDVVLVGCQRPSRITEIKRNIGDEGEILVFEIDPDNYERLVKSTPSLNNVTFDNRGVWFERGDRQLGLRNSLSTGYRVLDEGAGHQWDASDYDDTRQVEVETLDILLDEYGFVPDYIEILVNGTEPEVLQGARRTLEKDNLKLLLKTYGLGGSTVPNRVDELVTILEQYDFNYIFAPIRSRFRDIEPYDPDGDIFAWK